MHIALVLEKTLPASAYNFESRPCKQSKLVRCHERKWAVVASLTLSLCPVRPPPRSSRTANEAASESDRRKGSEESGGIELAASDDREGGKRRSHKKKIRNNCNVCDNAAQAQKAAFNQ